MIKRIFFDLPLFIAQFTFLPLGFSVGFVLYHFSSSPFTIAAFLDAKYTPFLVAAVVAVITGISMFLAKVIYKQFRYEHFYVMTIGMLLIWIGSFIIRNSSSPPIAGIYMSQIGTGICYVSALAYVNIRTENRLHLNITKCHFFYLIGVAASATTYFSHFDDDFFEDYFDWYSETNDNMGTTLILTSSITLLLYVLNEGLHHHCSCYDYKKSLDLNVNQENESKEIFINKHFSVSSGGRAVPTDMGKRYPPIVYLIFGILSKIHNVILFYYPFYFIHQYTTSLLSDSESRNYYVANWMAAIGFTISFILIAVYQYRNSFMIAGTIKILIFIVILGMATTWSVIPTEAMKSLFWILFLILGFGYSYSDINLLTFINLKYSDLALALGYAVETSTVGILYYYSIYKSWYFLPTNDIYKFLLNNFISIGVVLLVLIVMGYKIIPIEIASSKLEMSNFLGGNMDRDDEPTIRPPPTITPSPTVEPPPASRPVFPHQHPQWNPNNQTVHYQITPDFQNYIRSTAAPSCPAQYPMGQNLEGYPPAPPPYYSNEELAAQSDVKISGGYDGDKQNAAPEKH